LPLCPGAAVGQVRGIPRRGSLGPVPAAAG
jgi:hypothetical protein